ncbi:MAG TPA: TonB-dependent receptor [Candidatus Acidoferrum sp.]|nr:TonB-dependent receptor [Candidatus Acidoferrum sp.]
MTNLQTLRRFGFIFLLLAAILFAPLARGQNANTGEIKGAVMDPSGAVVPDVAISIKNVQTGIVTPTTTNQAGLYDVPFLAPGSYTIKFSKQNFRDFVREGIVLQIQTLEINATLQLGVSTQEVVVNAAGPLVETETSDQHVDISTQAVNAAPIVGTDWRADMVQLIPGVNAGGGTGEADGQSVGVNGTQQYNVNFLIDGSAATAPRDYNSSNYYMPLDAIQEVSVNASNAPAQYGNGLTSINVITKSGTNQWHGSAYEYDQNTAFNARSYYNHTGPKSVEHWNEYGGSVSGPVIKNKLFFFFTYQRNPSSTPAGGNYTYPTAAMEAGDFYGIPGATGPAFSATGTLLATPDPVALKLQSYFPATNAPGWIPGCPGPVNVSATVAQTCSNSAGYDYVFATSSPNKDTWYTGKADYNISSKQKLSFSFNYFPTVSSYVAPDPLYPNDATSYSVGDTDNLTGQLSDVYTFSSNVLNEFRLGGSRELDKYKPPSLGKNDPTTLGLEPAYGTNAPADIFPKITIDQGAGIGCIALGAGCGENGNIDAVLGEGVYNVADVLTLIRGRHTIKVGGEYDRIYQNYTFWGDLSSGNFEFNGATTNIPYADFLAGDVYGWYVYNYDATSAHSWASALFASDDYKVSSHLTVNLGLRWQMQSGWSVKGDLFGNYDPFLPNPGPSWGPLPSGTRGAILYGGQSDTVYGGSTNNMSTIQNGDYKEFAPRIGVAWSPRDKWSVRASYGIFDAPRDAENYTDGALGLGFNPHGSAGYYAHGVPAFQLSVGPPAGTVVYPTLQTLSPILSNDSGVQYYPRNIPTTYVQQFLLSIQHEFVGGILLDASYVYTRGRNLNFQTDIDQAPASALGTVCPVSYTMPNCAGPVPQYTAISAALYDGWSNYNALQVRLQKRMSYGVNFQVNYAFSKSLDTGTGGGHGSGVDIYQNAYNPADNYGPSDFNSTHTLVGQIVYELPFGSGRQFAVHGPLDYVVGGWRVSSLFQWHSGVPFTPVIQSSVADALDPGLALSLANGSHLYPETVGNPTVSSPTLNKWFNPAAFANPAPGTFGNTGRMTLVGPGFANVGLSIAKEFRLPWREGMKLEIRGDAYNVFNHMNYANPNANVGYGTTPCPTTSPNAGLDLTDCSAGTITGPAAWPGNGRIMQLGAHFTF